MICILPTVAMVACTTLCRGVCRRTIRDRVLKNGMKELIINIARMQFHAEIILTFNSISLDNHLEFFYFLIDTTENLSWFSKKFKFSKGWRIMLDFKVTIVWYATVSKLLLGAKGGTKVSQLFLSVYQMFDIAWQQTSHETELWFLLLMQFLKCPLF